LNHSLLFPSYEGWSRVANLQILKNKIKLGQVPLKFMATKNGMMTDVSLSIALTNRNSEFGFRIDVFEV
jgi:hypothetical protein